MKGTLVTRDQFNVSPQGIIHKPTDAAFTPYPDGHLSGTTRLGTLGKRSGKWRPQQVLETEAAEGS